MTEFKIQFGKTFEEVLRLTAAFRALGETADNTERKFAESSGTLKKLLKSTDVLFEKTAQSARELGVSQASANKIAEGAAASLLSTYARMQSQTLQTSLAARAYSGELKDLQATLNNTASMASFIKYQRQSANLSKEQAEQNKYLKALLVQLTTDTGRANAALKAQVAATSSVVTEDIRLRSELGKLHRANANFTGGLREQIAVQKIVLQGKTQAATQTQREINQVEALRAHMASLTDGNAKEVAILKVMSAAREREVTEEAKQKIRLAELYRELRSLNGGMAEAIVKSEQMVSARRKQIQADNQASNSLKELTSAEALSRATNERSTSALKAKNAATLEAARATQVMGRQEAEALAKSEALAAATKRKNTALLEEARAAHGMSAAQKELTAARDRELTRLVSLRAQKELSASATGKEMTALRQQIVEQERYNRLLATSTAALLGFTSAHKASAYSLTIGSQSAAMLRAGLSGLQTSIGMYTSSTILMASSTYAVVAALRSAVTTGADFTAMMSRADAVMNSAGKSWEPSGLDAMESKVRALGATTSFTATEVAAGLVELGQAGLSSSEAMTGLSASLNLALIGNITMAESADIATNVMMMFHKGANDLTNVVDIMAVAASRSNTNITQLANALTYAGPAAHSAGISIEETTAAIAALSNNGIKASRAGTALRRLFVSLLNPTKKGQKVLSEYGVSVKDLEGNTKGLLSIVRQLNEEIPALDRLAAIQNLVGVYATSPIVALVSDPDELEKQLGYLETVESAAEKMRERIENSLKFDWKQVTSSFEELKLQVFDNFEWLLRYTSKQMTAWMTEMSRPSAIFDKSGNAFQLPDVNAGSITGTYDENGVWKANTDSLNAYREALEATNRLAEDSSNTVITKLEILVQKAKTFGTTLVMVAAGFAAFKLAGAAAGVFAALAADIALVSTTAGVLRDRLLAATGAGSAFRLSLISMGQGLSTLAIQAGLMAGAIGSMTWSQRLNAVATNASAMAMRAYGGALASVSAIGSLTWARVGAGALSLMSGAASLATRAVAGLAVAMKAAAIAGRLMMSALGWAGLIYGIYSAWQAYKSAKPEEQLRLEKERAKELKTAYHELSAAVDQYGYAREGAALREQLASDNKAIEAFNARKTLLEKAAADAKAKGLDVSFSAELKYIKQEREARLESIKATEEALKNRQLTQGASIDLSDRQLDLLAKLTEAEKELKVIGKNWQGDEKATQAAVAESMRYIRDLKRQIADLGAKAETASQQFLGMISKVQQLYNDQGSALTANWLSLTATDSQKAANILGELAEVRKRIEEGKSKNNDVSQDIKAETELLKDYQKLGISLMDTRQKLNEIEEERAALTRNEAEALEVLNAKIATQVELRDRLKKVSPNNDSEGFSDYVKAEETLLKLEKERASLQKKPEKTLESQLSKDLKAAKSTYDALYKQFDPLSASMDDVNEKTEQLALLHKNGKISAEEKAQSIWQLRKAHYELAIEQNKNYQSLENLRDSYLDSPFSSTLDDMVELNRLLKANNVSLAEYKRIKDTISERAVSEATSGLPTANLQMGNASSSPFSDWMGTEIERAQGLGQFGKRKDDLFTGYENDTDRIQREFEVRQASLDAELLQQQEHAERLKALEQEKNTALLAANDQFSKASMKLDADRAAYSEQMGKMAMISMLGTAENILGMFASAGEDSTNAQKAAFVAQKALAIAQILMYTHLAAAQAMAIPGDTTKVLGMSLAAFITAQGYASAALVGGLAIAEMSGAKPGGSSSGAYDDGGFIPYNSYGIVGEYGPEIVHGPANVTSREKSAKQLSGSAEYNITLAPQITVQQGEGGGGNGADEASKARELGKTLQNIVVATMKEQTRPGGTLDTWIKSQRRA